MRIIDNHDFSEQGLWRYSLKVIRCLLVAIPVKQIVSVFIYFHRIPFVGYFCFVFYRKCPGVQNRTVKVMFHTIIPFGRDRNNIWIVTYYLRKNKRLKRTKNTKFDINLQLIYSVKCLILFYINMFFFFLSHCLAYSSVYWIKGFI